MASLKNILNSIISYFLKFTQSPYAPYFLIICWIFIQSLLYNYYQVKLVNDSLNRYIPNAQQLTFKFPFVDPHELRYIAYISFLSIFLKLGLSFKAIVGIQTILSGFAAILLFKIIFTLSKNKFSAFIGTLLFITWKDLQYLNYFILTESFLASFLIFTFYSIIHTKNRIGILFSICLLVFTSLIRPNGFIVLFGALIYLIIKYRELLIQHKKTISLILLVFILVSLIVLNSWLHKSFYIVEEYQKGEIIYGDPQFALKPPKQLWMPHPDTPALLKIGLFILHNPIFFFKLAFTKTLFFLGYIKPYHSSLHKWHVILVLYPCYVFSIYTSQLKKISLDAKAYLICVILGQTLIIALTVEDWDNRFIMPFLPYIFILAAIGIGNLMNILLNLKAN